MATKNRGRNEGSISQRSNGRYRAQVSCSGKRVSASFRTKAECSIWIRNQQQKIDRGFDFQGSKITLGEYLPQWLEIHKASLRPKTASSYRQVMNKHIIPYLGKISLKDLGLARLEKYYADLGQSGVGVRTVRICHSILHVALEKALRYNLVVYNPAHGATLPQYRHAEMLILDETQVNQFLFAAQNSRYCALYHLAVTTGMRQGELFGLKWIDLLWTTGILHVQRQIQKVPGQGWSFTEPKTKAGRRSIKLGSGTLQVLRDHTENQNAMKEKAGERWQDHDLIFPC